MQIWKKESVFRVISQFINQLSASFPGRRCIFEQVKTEKEARKERFLARLKRAATRSSR